MKAEARTSLDEITGRGHRQKIPSEKIKEQVGGRIEKMDDDKLLVLPTYIAPTDPKFVHDQRELGKIYDHSKVGANGEKTDFFQLGTQ